MKSIPETEKPVYIMVAPAFLGQFSEGVTPGKLRTAFKKLGCTAMVEVALFADVLTLREALEFDRHVNKKGDFQLTSCCCPVWISMIRKNYPEMMEKVPASVSPMIACGRLLKRMYPDAVTVFVGPCLAKKREAKEPDIADAVDYVLTFQEVKDIFRESGIDVAQMEEEREDHASKAGRAYARTGGVSMAVAEMVEALHPNREIRVRSEQANGTKECMEMIERIKNGESDANFFEGMGCIGGCVGGPKAILPKEEGRRHVLEYEESAPFRSPIQNPYMLALLKELGFENIEDLLKDNTLLTRDFGDKTCVKEIDF